MSRNNTAYRYDDDRYYDDRYYDRYNDRYNDRYYDDDRYNDRYYDDDRYNDTGNYDSRNPNSYNTNTFYHPETNATMQQKTTAPTIKQRSRDQKHLHIRKAVSILYALGIMFFLVSGVVGIWLCSNASMMNYEIIDLKAEISKLESENNALISEIQSKSSLERVAKIAVNQLGMVKAEANPYVLDGKVIPCPVAEEPVVVADSDTAIEKVFDFLAEMKDKAVKSSMRFLAKQ